MAISLKGVLAIGLAVLAGAGCSSAPNTANSGGMPAGTSPVNGTNSKGLTNDFRTRGVVTPAKMKEKMMESRGGGAPAGATGGTGQ